MRPFALSIIISISVALFSGCAGGGASSATPGDKALTVITSFYPMYIHTINVCKGLPAVKVVNLTKPQTGCLHDYSITTNDMKTLERGQVFVINGLGMESFMDKVLAQMPNLKVVEASKGIEVIKDQNGEVNPHVWVSISNAAAQVKNIAQQLSAISPENAERFKNNADEYVKKLEAEKEKMHKALDGAKARDIVTFHEAFSYFAKEFNLNIAGVIEREPGTEPSPKELREIIETIRKTGTKAIFAEPQYPSKAADTIARETGLKVYSLDPVATGDANGDCDAYLKAMDNNLKVLEDVLR